MAIEAEKEKYAEPLAQIIAVIPTLDINEAFELLDDLRKLIPKVEARFWKLKGELQD